MKMHATLKSNLQEHQQRVAAVQKQVAYHFARKQRIRIYHGASNSTRLQNFEADKIVDTSALTHVIEVNEAEQYILVEPSVTMDQLVAATLPYGLVPPVVMEFPGISVGGGIQGGAAESSSFKWGGFHETALEYEIVLGDGTLVTASRQENADLFWGTAFAYGSLGILTLIKLRLIPAKPFVSLTYHKVGDAQAALTLLKDKSTDRTLDFIDGILYSDTSGVIMTGTFADKPAGPVATFTKRDDDWFYLHAKHIIRQHDHHVEYIPLADYLFRYDRGAFWMGEAAMRFLKIPFIQVFRRLLDRQLHTRYLYRIVHKTDLSQRYIVQDIFFPAEAMATFLDYIRHKLHIYPLWLLPMKPSREKLDVHGLNFTQSDLVINVGIWGKAKTKTFEEFAALNRELEHEARRLGGRKTLYAHAYYTEDEFWAIYDRKHYDTLRKKYKAETIFTDIYHKTVVRAAYNAPLWKAILRHFWRRATNGRT